MKLPRFRWRGRWVRHIEWSLASLATTIVFLIILVDWNGWQQWREVKARLAKEGLTFDLRAVAPDPIPDAENFCAIPLLKDITVMVDGYLEQGEPGKKRARLKAVSLTWDPANRYPAIAGSALGQGTDLHAWAWWMRGQGLLPAPEGPWSPARETLTGLSPHEPVIQELAAGLDRTRAQWTPAWKTRGRPQSLWNPFSYAFPQLSSTSGLHTVLALRSIAAARSGDARKAHESAQIMERLDEASLEEPHLHALLAAAIDAPLLADATWEICDAHAGTAEDFLWLESALRRLDFRAAAIRATRSELIIGVEELRYAMKHSENGYGSLYLGPLAFRDFTIDDVAVRCMPSGFFDANAAVLADREFENFVKPIRDDGWRAAFLAARRMESELGEQKRSLSTHPSSIATSVSAAGIPHVIFRSIYAQTVVNQAIIACVLERFRITHGSYPDSLDEGRLRLAWRGTLPLDIMTGKPMSYRRTLGRRYVLWSAGFDGKNHGGWRAHGKENPARSVFYREDYAGDWVWDFPETPLRGIPENYKKLFNSERSGELDVLTPSEWRSVHPGEERPQ